MAYQKTTQPTTTKAPTNRPQAEFRAGAVRSTTWLNKAVVDGQEREFLNVTVERSYKDKEDKWQTTNTFPLSDVPKLIACLQESYKEAILKSRDPQSQDNT